MALLQLLLAPALALMGISFLFNLVLQGFSGKQLEQYAFGSMFGGAIAIGMINPLSLGEGLIFDARSLLIGAAIAFVGLKAGAIATGIAILCRLAIGGAGVVAGVLGLVLAFALGAVWLRYVYPRIRPPILADATLGLAMTLSIAAVFVLPLETAMALFTTVSPSLLVCNVFGMVALGLMFRREIAQLHRRRELEEHATRDPLTKLLNRRGLDNCAKAMRGDPGPGRAVYYFDVDNFKQINDLHGHEVGDGVLEVIATRINDNLRSDAIFARQGGDEFSIFMPNLAKKDVRNIADRICSLIRDDTMVVRGQKLKASISLGAYWSNGRLDLDDMLRRADDQLLLAKKAGKDRAQVGYDMEAAGLSVA